MAENYGFSDRLRGELFDRLSIWKEEKYQQLQGTYPVIFLSFASIKATEYKKMEYKITEVIAALYAQNGYLLEGTLLNENEKEYFKSIKPGIGDEVAAGAINAMANFMHRYYGKRVIILLDEYDTPMQEAWLNGYWDEAVELFRGLFNSTFKTNNHLERGLITGITRISKEFNQLDGSTNAVWSMLLAAGYLKVQDLEYVGERKRAVYTLALTNMETRNMFEDMVKGWFGGSAETAYNNFVKALLLNDVESMNEYMLLTCNNCKKIVDFLNDCIPIKPVADLQADKFKKNNYAAFAASSG